MIVTLEHVGGSWWWHQNMCNIHCSDGRKVSPSEDDVVQKYGGTYEIHETPEGIEARYFHCSSGQGKQLSHTKLIIPRAHYAQVIHTGKEPTPPPADIFSFVKKETGW
jgi:hypothetical protein